MSAPVKEDSSINQASSATTNQHESLEGIDKPLVENIERAATTGSNKFSWSTLILFLTLLVVVFQGWQQKLSTDLLIRSVEQQTRATEAQNLSTKQQITPNVGVALRVADSNIPGLKGFHLMITNYSDFPLYLKEVTGPRFVFPPGEGWPTSYFRAEKTYVPPRGTERLAVFGSTQENLLNQSSNAWPIIIIVRTATGNNWEIVFRYKGTEDLWFESMRLIDLPVDN